MKTLAQPTMNRSSQDNAFMNVAWLAATAVILVLAIVAATFSVAGGHGEGGGGGQGAHEVKAQSSTGILPGQVFQFTADQQSELRELTNTPAKLAAFQENLRKGVAAFGLTVSDKDPSAPGRGQEQRVVQSAAYHGDADVEDIFSQGWDRDHWWLIMSYADAAYGGTAGATAACSAYLPWFVCVPIGGIIASWIRGWGSGNNHGVWLAVYRSGWITGGRW